jgi:hypothetical protein
MTAIFQFVVHGTKIVPAHADLMMSALWAIYYYSDLRIQL